MLAGLSCDVCTAVYFGFGVLAVRMGLRACSQWSYLGGFGFLAFMSERLSPLVTALSHRA